MACSFCWEGRDVGKCADTCHDGDCPIGSTMVGWPHDLTDEGCTGVAVRPVQEQINKAAETMRIEMYRNDFDSRKCAESILKEFLRSLPPTDKFFWVIERFVDGQSAGYWNGCNSTTFVSEIDSAIQFRRKEDAIPLRSSYGWRDVQITQHAYVSEVES